MSSAAQKNSLHTPDIRNELKALPLFKKVSDALLDKFANAAQLRAEPKGKLLYLQGDKSEWFYVITHGWVKLFRETIEGTEAVIDVLTSGHIFGDTAIFESDDYSNSAEVVEAAQLIVLPTSLLKREIEENNVLALNMLSSMSQYRRQQSREIEHLSIQNAPQRIGCFMLRLCPISAPETVTITLPYDKTLIASRLGMKPETFSRALAKLKQETQIEIKGPMVTIHDMQRLVTYTCNHCSSSFPCEDLKD